MKKISHYLLFILFSCNTINYENEKKQKAQVFYNQLSDIINEVRESENQFTLYFRKIAPLAKQNFDYKIESLKIDSLNKLYSEYLNVLNKSIEKLNSLEEFDTSLKIKNSFTKIYTISKNSYTATIPTYLYVYIIGWQKASEYEKNIIMNADRTFGNAAKEISVEQEVVTKQLMNFMKKYRIKSKSDGVN